MVMKVCHFFENVHIFFWNRPLPNRILHHAALRLIGMLHPFFENL